MFVPPPELAADLEWMLQSGQVSTHTLIETLTREHERGGYGLAFAVLGDAGQALRALRAAFISAAVNRYRYRAAWGARPWVYRLILQACRTVARSTPASPSTTPPASVDARLQPALAALPSLSPAERAALYLEAAGMPESEAAMILGLRPGSFPARLAAAWNKLASCLPGDPGFQPILSTWLASCCPPEQDETGQAAWVDQAAAEAARLEKRRPLAVLGREFAFFGVLLAILAGAFFGAQRFYPSAIAAPTPQVVIRIIRITATPAATPSAAPSEAPTNTTPYLPPFAAADGSVHLPLAARLPITATLDTAFAFTQTVGWSQSGSLGLAGVLNYWGLNRPPGDVLAALQPNPEDQTVMAYELLAYVEAHTPYRALLRFGGDEILLARLVQAGFPVLIERYNQPAAGSNWMGRYEVVIGYENNWEYRMSLWMPYQPLTAQFEEDYIAMQPGWQALNYDYLIIYPLDREKQLLTLLSTDADERTNLANATWRASAEIYSVSSDLSRFFAWFNYGVNLAYQDDYRGAAEAFDEAYAIHLTLGAPFPMGRLLLYQTRPYWAYFYTGRYLELVELASRALENAQGGMPEEGYYWRGLAREALGDMDGAIQDLRQAVQLNPNFEAGLYHLGRMTESG